MEHSDKIMVDRETLTKRAHGVLQFLASLPCGSGTLDEDDFRSLMLKTGGSMFACGSLYRINGEHLGAGVFKVTLRRPKWSS